MSSGGTGAPASSAAPASSSAAAAGGAGAGAAGRNGPPNYHRLERLGKGSFATVRGGVMCDVRCCCGVTRVRPP